MCAPALQTRHAGPAVSSERTRLDPEPPGLTHVPILGWVRLSWIILRHCIYSLQFPFPC